jgi:hypothetical protein
LPLSTRNLTAPPNILFTTIMGIQSFADEFDFRETTLEQDMMERGLGT